MSTSEKSFQSTEDILAALRNLVTEKHWRGYADYKDSDRREGAVRVRLLAPTGGCCCPLTALALDRTGDALFASDRMARRAGEILGIPQRLVTKTTQAADGISDPQYQRQLAEAVGIVLPA